jgi:hypothetical protein
MWYEINVGKDGKHYFATHERSITTVSRAVEIRDRLKQAMPEEEGFTFTITQKQTVGVEIKN